MYYTNRRKKRKGRIVFAAVIFFAILFGIYYISGFGFHPIKINLPKNNYIGKSSYFITISDDKAAIKEVRITITNSLVSSTVFEKRFTNNFNKKLIKFKIPANMMDGNATINVFVSDKSIRHFLQGASKNIQKQVIIDKKPPQIEVYGLPIRIDKGGIGLPIWSVKDKFLKKTWVSVDGYNFSGYNAKTLLGKDNFFSTFITWPVYSDKRIGNATVSAVDLAGNITTVHLPVYWKQKIFRKTSLTLTSLAIDKAKQAAEGKSFSSNKELFLYVNRILRQKDNSEIRKICSKSQSDMLWHRRFLQLPHSMVTAQFADLRSYFMGKQFIDKEMHLGYDLASIAHSNVPAAASGIIKFTGRLYLYGNVIIIDHGFGLFSLYAHLSKINVKKGMKVKQGDIIGITGQTGMAEGDHLHFGVYVSGIPVDPIYLWDRQWIKDHITERIQSVKSETI